MSDSEESQARIPYPPRRLYPVIAGVRVPNLLAIDPGDLTGEYQMLASWLATATHQAMLCEVKVERQERKIKELESSTYVRLLSGVAKKPSEGVLKANVSTSAEISLAYAELFEMMEERSSWSSLKQGLIAKKDMIINLGAGLRIEQKSILAH